MPVFKSYQGELAEKVDAYRRRGAQEGGSNHPPTPATHPDHNEIELDAAARKHINDEQHLFDTTLTEVTRTLGQIQQTLVTQKTTNQRLLDDDSLHADVEAYLAADRHSLVTAIEAKLEREADFNRYRKLNGITDTAVYPDSNLWHLAILAACMVAETFGNAVFYENEQGLLGGAVVALAVSVINMGAAFVFGFFFRYKNLPTQHHKVLGWVSFLAFFLSTLYCNALFSAFRTHYQRVADPSNPAEVTAAFGHAWKAAGRIFVLDYAPSDMLSFLLFVIGIGLSILAFWKGYTIEDPHPGYGPRHRLYRRSLEAMQQCQASIRTKLTEYLTKRQLELQTALTAGATLQNQLGLATAQVETASKALNSACQAVQRDYELLIKVYRDANLAVRTTPAPEYFQAVPLLAATLSSAQSAEVRTHISAVTDEVSRLREDFDQSLSKKLQELKTHSAQILNDVYREFLAAAHNEAVAAITARMPIIADAPPSRT